MSVFKVFKETSVPSTLTPNAVYLVAPPSQPEMLEIYVSDSSGTASRRTYTKSDIESLIQDSLDNLTTGSLIVNDIAERDALTLTEVTEVIVLDASDDPTVGSGFAKYVWRTDTSEFLKLAEGESMDVTVNWSDIVGGPSSSPSQIDAAVSNSHTHANKTQLDGIDEDSDGELTYNGNNIRARLETSAW